MARSSVLLRRRARDADTALLVLLRQLFAALQMLGAFLAAALDREIGFVGEPPRLVEELVANARVGADALRGLGGHLVWLRGGVARRIAVGRLARRVGALVDLRMSRGQQRPRGHRRCQIS